MENKWYTILGIIAIIAITIGVIVRGPALKEKAQEQQDNDQNMEPEIQQYDNPPEMILEEGVDYQAKIKTNKGSFLIDLHEEDTPITVNNFVFLANNGFYNNVPFHRVVEGFMIQTGDPTGTGTGGPGYRFADEEFEGSYEIGTVAMANAGPDTNGSQFFIMHGDFSDEESGQYLQPNYTIFAHVLEGKEVVDEIATVDVTTNARGERSVPLEDLYIESVEILKK